MKWIISFVDRVVRASHWHIGGDGGNEDAKAKVYPRAFYFTGHEVCREVDDRI